MAEKLDRSNLLSKLTWANILSIVVGLGTILIRRNFLPEKVPFFYSRPWGEEQLTSKNWLFLIPLSSLILLVLHRQAGRFLQKKGEDFFSLVLACGSFLFSILGTITLIKIIFLIT